MKIITISREFGSGGRELGRRLAEIFGWDYYDKQIITSIASNQGMDENDVTNTMEVHGWKNIPLTFHRSFARYSSYPTRTDLLLEQKRVIEQIGKTQNNCIIVGRNADVLLQEHEPFNIFVCADLDAKVQRCIERAPEEERLSAREIERKIRRIDKDRAQVRELITGSRWAVAGDYHLTVNTTTWNIEALSPVVAEFVKSWYKRNPRESS